MGTIRLDVDPDMDQDRDFYGGSANGASASLRNNIWKNQLDDHVH